MAEVRLRIVSDLHIAEGPSRVRHARGLLPLLDDAARLVLNGDSLETRFLDVDPSTVPHKEAFDEFVAAQRERLTVVTGNHDPDISPLHHLEVEGGRVLVTHGDALFPDMAPWGWEARHFRREQEQRLAATPAAIRATWETRLRVCKEAIFAIRHLSPRAPAPDQGAAQGLFRRIRNVRRFHQIPISWFLASGRAARIAEQYRPAARLIVNGHFHFPGVWRSAGRTVINTGSSMRPLGGLAVDFVDDRIELRRLEFAGGEVRAGSVRKTLDLERILGAG